MMKLNKTLLLTAILAGSTISGTALAYPTVTINDNYVGADDQGYGDRIGGNTFEVHNMEVTLTGSTLNVQINTNYAGNTGLYGTGYGDLFLSSSWTPFGAAPYAGDDNTNGTNWTYGFSLDGDVYSGGNIDKANSTRFNSDAGGAGSLYQLNGTNDQNAILSDDVTGSIFRNGQEVIVDETSATVSDTGNNGTWTISAGNFINFSIDLSGTDLLNGDAIALHWGMTCGNDTIEGQYQLPEPSIVMLLSLGLAGFGFASARKRKQ